MEKPEKPALRPANPSFSSGPCPKRPGWSVKVLDKALLGRSHRCRAGRDKLADVVAQSRALLGLPDDYHLGLLPGSCTGAFEAALWSLLGPRRIDVLAYDAFGQRWADDITGQLGLADTRVIEAGYGDLPDLKSVDFSHDVVFVWNGTSSGVAVPDGDWIADQRQGLTFCDVTSAAFMMDIPWDKIDVAAWSWQKALGGEAQHGMLALSPGALARLENTPAPRPLPKVFRLTGDFLSGATLNTPSLLAIEDVLDALAWGQGMGGLPALMERTRENSRVLGQWVEASPWADYLCSETLWRSPACTCLTIAAPWFTALDLQERSQAIARMTTALEAENAAFDITSYPDAPPGLRIWTGPTVATDDISALLPWLDWAYATLAAEY